MPNNPTDTEIKKALELHSRESNSCGSNCPYLMCEEVMCTKKLSKDALDLINRYEAENERLKGHLEQLKHRYDISKQNTKTAKAEAYKEFAEKLKKQTDNLFVGGYRFSANDIDNLLKELAGDVNG